ncbi:MAG: hypothetical protein J0M12_02905 [Deltaproteobacteria bacterium]|nr:hypothetical protein [Deltaproteobacteria bacterium]
MAAAVANAQATQSESQVDSLLEGISDELALTRQTFEAYLPSNHRPSSRHAEQLQSELLDCSRRHVAALSCRDLDGLAQQLLERTAKDPESGMTLRLIIQEKQRTTKPLRDILFTSLCEAPQVNVERFEELTPEHRRRAHRNLGTLLERASDTQLKGLCHKCGIHKEQSAQSRRQDIDSLLESGLLERSLEDSDVAIELSSVLAKSGELSPGMSSLLEELADTARRNDDTLRGEVARLLAKEVAHAIEETARTRLKLAKLARAQNTIVIELDDSLSDMLAAHIEHPEDGESPLLHYDPFKLLAEELLKEDDALRVREKEEDREEEEIVETRHALSREIQKLARANPELFNSLAALSLEQLEFLDPMSVALRVPPFRNELG